MKKRRSYSEHQQQQRPQIPRNKQQTQPLPQHYSQYSSSAASIEYRLQEKRKKVQIYPKNLSQENYLLKLNNLKKMIIFAIGPAGTGKAQPLDAKIKIPGGWTTMGEIQRGDLVSTPDGNTAQVVDLFPQGYKDTYIMELKDGRKTECCGDHLWEVFYTDYWRKPRIMSTVDIIKFQQAHKKPMKIRLPEHEHQPDIMLPIDPYVLGALLGDGSFASYPRIGFSTADTELLDKMNLLCNGDGYFDYIDNYNYIYRSIAPSTTSYAKGNFATQLQTAVNELKLFGTKSDTKFIPEIYLHASKSQKIRLLQGLFDTDGYASNGNELVYTTVSKQLCDSVVYLIRSIGGAAKVKAYTGSYVRDGVTIQCKLTYDVSVCYKAKRDLVSLLRKANRLTNDCQYSKKGTMSIKSITPAGYKECQCILIDSKDHLYITDDFIVTHNTMLGVQWAVDQLKLGKFDKIIVTRPAVSVDEEHGFLPGDLNEKMSPWTRPIFDVLSENYSSIDIELFVKEGIIETSPLAYMRGRTFKNAVIIADEMQNATPSQMKMLLTRLGENSKMVVTGDLQQADRPTNNGLLEFLGLYNNFENHQYVDICHFTMEDIERHVAVKEILAIYGES